MRRTQPQSSRQDSVEHFARCDRADPRQLVQQQSKHRDESERIPDSPANAIPSALDGASHETKVLHSNSSQERTLGLATGCSFGLEAEVHGGRRYSEHVRLVG